MKDLDYEDLDVIPTQKKNKYPDEDYEPDTDSDTNEDRAYSCYR